MVFVLVLTLTLIIISEKNKGLNFNQLSGIYHFDKNIIFGTHLRMLYNIDIFLIRKL